MNLINAEDHGWSLSIYDGNKRTFHYECTWEDDIDINQEEYDRDRIVELINKNPNKLQSVTPLDITKVFYIANIEEAFETDTVHQIADLLRLENYEWISYEYVRRGFKEDLIDMQKGIKFVNSIFSF